MDPLIAVALDGMRIGMAKVDNAAMNIANAGTAGYRRIQLIQGALAHEESRFASAMKVAGQTVATSGVSSALDVRPGALRATGGQLDLAISGSGYFEVMTPAGPVYTRNGAFAVDARGRLGTAEGFPVMGTNGEIFLQPGAVSVAASGAISQPGVRDGEMLSRLKVVRFAPGEAMRARGNGLLAPAGNGPSSVAEDAPVRQGYLETSNVNHAHEMTQLMLAVRQFETMQKLVQGRDDTLGTAIRKLGENP